MSRIPRSRRLLSLLVAVPFVVVACNGDDADDAGGQAVAQPAESAATAAPASPVAPDDDATETAERWLDIELTDAATGETFTLASLGGEVVAIEPMAVWCTSCKRQQDNVKQVYADIEAAGVRYISLGIDPGEDPEMLARYAERHGYEWTFVQSPTAFSRAINDRFGPQILSAPSTPLIVLDPSGEVAAQTFGPHAPDDVLAILEEAAA